MSKDTAHNPTIDLSIKKEDGYALYVPAISSSYCHWVSQWDEKINGTDKEGKYKYKYRQPKKLSRDAKELYFLDPNNSAFHYNAGLYSAGHSHIFDLNESQKIEKLVHSRNKSNTVIVADSGGYQIATAAGGSAVSKFDWENPMGKQSDEVRMAILRWMESVADYSMMLDVPSFTIDNNNPSVKSFADCIKYTQYNADFFVKNRTPGATKILNVLQGRSVTESNQWWDVFKDYPFEGWAMGGPAVRDINVMLRRLIIMRDGGYLGGDRNWLHVLGTSRLSSACVLTEIQRSLRATVDKNFTISFDSATPFVVASKGFIYTQTIFEAAKKTPRFAYLTHKMIECLEAVGSSKPFPFTSIPARFMTLGDICCRDPAVSGTATTWDSFSYVLLMWHNLYKQIEAIQEALRVYDMPSKQIKQFVPASVLEFKDLCNDIFTSDKPMDMIEKNTRLLRKITTGSDASRPQSVSHEFFMSEENSDELDIEAKIDLIMEQTDGRGEEGNVEDAA